MADDLDEIRARVRIVDLVGQSVSLKKAGRNWTGLCPFHADKNPSFTVSEETGRYRCWSCGERGDIFNWVMKTQNMEFGDALRHLATLAGVTLKGTKGTDATVRERYRQAMTTALEFFAGQLSKSAFALEYCESRGIGDAVRKEWELGFAPEMDTSLTTYLQRAGVSLKEAKELFLTEEDPSGGFFDKFRRRLMFPIRDERGQLVAFGGRIIGDGIPKYINSSDTPLFRKSRTLYGLYRAREALKAGKPAVLCEGYLDVIACVHAGVESAVASLGTSLTEDHARLLARWTDSVVILYDGDEAGIKAANRAAEILRAEGLKVRVATLPAGEDPDTLLKSGGPGAVVKVVEGGLTPTGFQVERLLQTLQPSEEEFWKEAVRILATSGDKLEVASLVQRLAPLYPGLRDPREAASTLRKMVSDASKGEKRQSAVRPVSKRIATGLKSADEMIFRAFLSEGLRVQAWTALANADLLQTTKAMELASSIRMAFPEAAPAGPPSEWLHHVEPTEMQNLLDDLQSLDLLKPTPQGLEDAIALLERKREQRDLERVKTDSQGDERLAEISQRLKRLKN